MYCITCWYDWDGNSCAPDGYFCFFKTFEETRKILLRLIVEYAKEREYKISIKKILQAIKLEGKVLEISISELFDEENDYSKFKIERVVLGEMIPIC